MDPYKAPESNSCLEREDAPKSIKLVFSFIALSFLIFLLEEFVYAADSENGIFDIYNYYFVPIWGGILYWVSNKIREREENPKITFLILAILVSSVSILFPLREYSIYTGVGEGVCFLVVYFLLGTKSSKEWFA